MSIHSIRIRVSRSYYTAASVKLLECFTGTKARVHGLSPLLKPIISRSTENIDAVRAYYPTPPAPQPRAPEPARLTWRPAGSKFDLSTASTRAELGDVLDGASRSEEISLKRIFLSTKRNVM
jgi:hypothetical protein